MPQSYVGFTLNDDNTSTDWSLTELANFKDIIDLLGIGPDYPGTTGNPRGYNLCLGNSGVGVPVRLGIGMAAAQTPASPLHIYGGASGGTPNANALLTLEDDTLPVLQFLSPSPSFQYIYFGDNGSATAAQFGFYHSAATDFFTFAFGGTANCYITATGLSVGTSLPSYDLHVQGTASETYLYQSGAAGAVAPLFLRQADDDAQIIKFKGYSNGAITGTFVPTALVGVATLTGYIQVYVEDDTGGGIADDSYFIPFYHLT